MAKQKKLNKFKIILVIVIVIFTLSVPVFGRYIYTLIREAYFSAKQFYFTSDILTASGANYTYTNWGGLDSYEIVFNLYSYNNELAKLHYDLEYTVTCESLSTDKITCLIDDGATGSTSVDGIIYATTNESQVKIKVTPKTTISKDEIVKLKVTAKTEEPYQKEISCTYSLQITQDTTNTFTIEDVKNRDYAILELVNKYETATPVVLEFDPDELRLDLNDEIYRDNDGVETTTDASGDTYINKIKFILEAESSKNVKFYKVNKSEDYSYPNDSGTSAITVTY